MKDSTKNVWKYVSLIGLAMTNPIGITVIISRDKKLIILNTIQSLAFPIFFASETYRGNIRID
ncbi:MAG: hypothetical protein ACTHVE_07430 [Senegalia sp. (in: firmicutes)]|uniref:hypothetical protein n=1 Tax=Senegalia sp. (in: firmicutes) TaxID=1924098 RepID=UPI003F9C741D